MSTTFLYEIIDSNEEERNNRNTYLIDEKCFSQGTDGNKGNYDYGDKINGNKRESYGNDINDDERAKLLRNNQIQWMKQTKNTISCRFIEIFILFLSTLRVISACPDVVTSICRCDDSQNGIVLKCSNTDGAHIVQTLKANQINLGLIQQLEMQNSGLKQIPAGFFSGLFIKKLDLSHNNIAEVDENGFLGMSSVLQELILHHNNLTKLPAKALIPLSALLRIDLSNNSIGDIEAEHALPPISKLYDVSLANNRICQVHKNAFDDVKYSLQTINLGRNCLKEVPAAAIRGFKQLMALHLHNNNITSLGALSFMNLPQMNLLNLASNHITTIHKQTFLNVPNLKYLYLTRNRITNISPHQFSSFEQLEMLDLTGNYLNELQQDSFSNLQSLRQLYLGENQIANIEKQSFTNSSVVILILNSNRLVTLEEGMFDGLVKLQQLGLKDNQIRTIDQNSFYSNPSLAMIDLSGNELMDIPPTTFLAQINLFLIDLSSNKLLRTPYGAFSRRVKTVLLQENPLVCSERVHMLQQGVGIYIANSKDAICGTKKDYENSTENDFDGSNTSSYFTIENIQETKIKAEEKQSAYETSSTSSSKIAPIIRPIPIINDKVSIREGQTEEETINDELIPIRPIHVTANEQSLPSLPLPIIPNAVTAPESGSRMISSKYETHNYGTGRNDNYKLLDNLGLRNRSRPEESDNHSFHTNNNKIYPFPVPFLKRPLKPSRAFVARFSSTPFSTDQTTTNINKGYSEQTLPPSIVVADHVHESDQDTLTLRNNYNEKVSIENAKDVQANEGEIIFDLDNTERLERVAAPSVIILICLSTVAIVMAAVLIGLCIAKHRRLQTFRDSMTTDNAVAARTNAYVAAQLDMINGTVQRNRNISVASRLDDTQPWIYAPASYATSGYYK
ncbi:unnamed protein product [Thelazia callipaeda]|uniref:LRRNT domain-containing protein n=1 Tax=Thelazia callipaeda TaxID=103827 RepID=A0A0N5D2M2_THECL|nr:unnamed protein product [Thelazia callipaeda]